MKLWVNLQECEAASLLNKRWNHRTRPHNTQSRLPSENEHWPHCFNLLNKTDQVPAAPLQALFGGQWSLVVKPRTKKKTKKGLRQCVIKILIKPSTNPNKPPRFPCSLQAMEVIKYRWRRQTAAKFVSPVPVSICDFHSSSHHESSSCHWLLFKMHARTQCIDRRPGYRCRVLDEIQRGSETSVSYKWWKRQIILCGILQPLRSP